MKQFSNWYINTLIIFNESKNQVLGIFNHVINKWIIYNENDISNFVLSGLHYEFIELPVLL